MDKVLEELLSHCRVDATSVSMPAELSLPTPLRARLTDAIWIEARDYLVRRMHTISRSVIPAPHPVSTKIQGRTAAAVVLDDILRPTVEAKIRSMSGADAIVLCRTHALSITPHPTNPGITAMRAKNSLLASSRKGELTI